MSVTDTLIDTLFDGRYRIVRKLGTGGMANVYLAEDQELGRRVAIKILDERHASDGSFVERFRREAKNAAGLSHANIVSIYDRGQAEGTYYIAMEYLDGRTLKELLVQYGPPPIRVAIGYVRQILAALSFAHKHGLVHRDIKPHNVIVDGSGHVKVTDFGIARSGTSQMTEAGSIIGTAQYLSPEQARGTPVDQRSDLYSVGILLYELLTGTVPFTGDTPVEIAMKHLSAVPKPPSQERAEIPRGLDQVVVRALAKDPEERYQTAEEMDADLARIERGMRPSDETADAATAVLAGSGIDDTAIRRLPTVTAAAYRAPPYAPYEAPVRRRPKWPWLLALILLAAAAIGGWYAYKAIDKQLSANAPVRVPLVEGQVVSLAKLNVRQHGLVPEIRHGFSDKAAVGHVYDQNPAAGQREPKGNTVVLFVSKGPALVTVPSVVGQSKSSAEDQLRSAGLTSAEYLVHSGQPSGTVVAQKPNGGARVHPNSAVRLNVSIGPQPAYLQDVRGQSYEQAKATLEQAGFKVQRDDVDSNQPAGTVIDESPAGGTQQPKGTTVTLSVSKGPTTTAVPSVRGDLRDDATATLQQAGFQVVVQQQDVTDPGSDGIVLRQNPAGGAQAKIGATVTITVGKLVQTTTSTTPFPPGPPPKKPKKPKP
jgi:eukaryotic-like serine/threonine-protein kinase